MSGGVFAARHVPLVYANCPSQEVNLLTPQIQKVMVSLTELVMYQHLKHLQMMALASISLV